MNNTFRFLTPFYLCPKVSKSDAITASPADIHAVSLPYLLFFFFLMVMPLYRLCKKYAACSSLAMTKLPIS